MIILGERITDDGHFLVCTFSSKSKARSSNVSWEGGIRGLKGNIKNTINMKKRV